MTLQKLSWFSAVPPGKCIYCGSLGPLGDEHIIPYGLGGRLVLPQASCRSCEKVTSRFERVVMRSQIWALRECLGIKRSRRKKRASIPVKGMTTLGVEYEVQMAPSDIGLLGAFPDFCEVPGYMVGREPGSSMAEFDVIAFYNASNIGCFGSPGSNLNVDVLAFSRMLAKIAHVYVTALVGIDNFIPFLLPLIKGTSADWSYLVGRAPIEDEISSDSHTICTFRQESPHDGILLTRLRLFAEIGAPTYDIVTGSMDDVAWGRFNKETSFDRNHPGKN